MIYDYWELPDEVKQIALKNTVKIANVESIFEEDPNYWFTIKGQLVDV